MQLIDARDCKELLGGVRIDVRSCKKIQGAPKSCKDRCNELLNVIENLYGT